ncbi:MAG: oligoendopeptidase, partial [Bradymonadaceae bacterium]
QHNVPMGLAETASTLLEALVEEAALKKAPAEEKIHLLDKRLGRAIAFLIDVPARYELELAMHQKRAEGPLHEELLRGMTKEVFESSFGDGVASVDDLFWASKLHFYLAYLPFYNFPYTFGYLFSRAVYDRARERGPEFIPVIDDLLRDTGRLSSEEIGRKYLDADLESPDFWARAAESLKDDVAEYRRLVNAATRV